MSLVAILLLGVFAQLTFADEPEAIIGGAFAQSGEFPYQCSLRMNGEHVCGCTIVSSTCIVTAAHCLAGVAPPPYTSLKVVTGTLDSNGGKERAIKIAKIHPYYQGYVQDSWMYDAAVLILQEPIQFNMYQFPIRVATETPRNGTYCVVSGWGKTSVNSQVAPLLRKAYNVVIDNNTCQKFHYSQPIYNVHLCTYAGHGVGACLGDSGGPLVCNGELCGIVSWIMPCAIGYPDVFCNVAVVRPFIQAVCPAI